MSRSPLTDDLAPIDPAIVAQRVRDYQRETDERTQLVELWRLHYPEGAAERSAAFHPLVLAQTVAPNKHRLAQFPLQATDPDEIWVSDVYAVHVRRYVNDPVFGSHRGMIQLGVSNLDGTARHDWRDLQAIKNQLAGPETEAFELYPAEARLLDPSNYFTLWCFPGLKRIKVGIEMRRVLDAEDAISSQRALSAPEEAAAIPMVLHCPRCRAQHVDAPDLSIGWTNPPHRSHLCGLCGCVWRPADVPTTGVAATASRGKGDTWPPAF